jgi:Fe-S-cluster containining protein
MECREFCGACCIIPNLTTPIPGMPGGKPAFTPCIHLQIDFSCGIYNHPDRPKACAQFRAEELVCGQNREEAISILTSLMNSTL